MRKVYVGIDNGVSGSISIIITETNESFLYKTPVVYQQNYVKKKQGINRVDVIKFKEILNVNLNRYNFSTDIFAVLERPMVDTKRFRATMSAIRCLEATLIIFEDLEIPHMYIDSKEWQKALLPSGTKGRSQLKPASHDIGIRLFPHLKTTIETLGDADGILIAEYARRSGL